MDSRTEIDTFPGLFLDRDGVIVADRDLVTRGEDLSILPGVATAIARAQAADFRVVVVSNQSIVARGLASEGQVEATHSSLDDRLVSQGCNPLSAYYFCPHHPHADDMQYRLSCECRKPMPGMLLRAAEDLSIDLERSYMVGDRPSDILAGKRAGCRTILVETGQHEAPLIVGVQRQDLVPPDYVARDLAEAVAYILEAHV